MPMNTRTQTQKIKTQKIKSKNTRTQTQKSQAPPSFTSTQDTAPTCSSFTGTKHSDSSKASMALAKRRWREPEKAEAAIRGLCVGVWEFLREEIREGGENVDWGDSLPPPPCTKPTKKSKQNPHKTHKIWIQKENPSLNPFLNQNPYQILTPKPIGNHPKSKPMNHKSTHHQPQCFNQSTSTNTTTPQSSKFVRV